jgi:hypothetical protein
MTATSTSTMASSSKSISLAYSLHPPQAITTATPKENTHDYPIESSSSQLPAKPTGISAYYAAALPQLRNAQKALNEDLTVWKDAIGDLEKPKEDIGKVGYGQGRGARMAAGVKATESVAAGTEDVDEDDAEDDGVIEDDA